MRFNELALWDSVGKFREALLEPLFSAPIKPHDGTEASVVLPSEVDSQLGLPYPPEAVKHIDLAAPFFIQAQTPGQQSFQLYHLRSFGKGVHGFHPLQGEW